jgi:hypothetical protein
MKEGQDHAAFVQDRSHPIHMAAEDPSDSTPLISSDQIPPISAPQEINEESHIRAPGLIRRFYNYRETNWLLWEIAVLIFSVLLALIISMVFPDPVVAHISACVLLIGIVGALY